MLELTTLLTQYPEWTHEHGQLIAVFSFPRFLAAIAVINAVAVAAEELQHYPSYTHNFTTITFRLSTHEAGSTVTKKDIVLAQRISEIIALSEKRQ